MLQEVSSGRRVKVLGKLNPPVGMFVIPEEINEGRKMFKHTYYSFEPHAPYGKLHKHLVPAQYYASIYKPHNNDSYMVEFIDFDGCSTYGETMEHALKMAHDALAVWLEDIPPENWPKPSNCWCYPDSHLISVLVDVGEEKPEESEESDAD